MTSRPPTPAGWPCARVRDLAATNGSSDSRKGGVVLRKLVLLAMTAGLLGVVVAQPGAQAAPGAGTISGIGVIDCVAALPVWPSQVIVQGGACPGVATGVIGGVTNPANGSTPYVIDCTGGCPFGAAFNYFEICPVKAKGVFPIVGFATGAAVVGPGPATTPLVPAARTATLTVPFNWIRVGIWAIIFDGKLGVLPFVPQKFAGPNKVLGMTPPPVVNPVANDAVGSFALAAFEPFLTKNNLPPPLDTLGPVSPWDCGTPGPQGAAVAAVDIEFA